MGDGKAGSPSKSPMSRRVGGVGRAAKGAPQWGDSRVSTPSVAPALYYGPFPSPGRQL